MSNKTNAMTINMQAVKRANEALTKTYAMFNSIAAKYQAGKLGKRDRLVELLINFRDYLISNLGVNPPQEAFAIFDYTDDQVKSISKRFQDLKEMYALLSPSRSKEQAGAHAKISQLLKDMASHVRFCIKAGWHNG